MKISIGTVELVRGSDYNEQPYDFVINHVRQIQVANILRAVSAKYYDRGNISTTLEFKVSRRHKDVESAQMYINQHLSILSNLSSTLTITEEPSLTSYSLVNAVISKTSSFCEGAVSTHFYKITGGNFLQG